MVVIYAQYQNGVRNVVNNKKNTKTATEPMSGFICYKFNIEIVPTQ